MAYSGKTDWVNNEIVEASDMNRIEQGISDIDVELGNVQVAVDELKDSVGDVATLTTTDKTSTVSAINEVKGDVASHLADYAYQTPTIVGTQIRIQKQSDTKRLYFKLANDLYDGNISISLDEGATSKPLKDIDGNILIELGKGFVEVVESGANFILRPRGVVSKEEWLALLREKANLTAVVDIYDRVTGIQDAYYDLFDGTNDHSAGIMDTRKTTASQALSAGTTVLSDKVVNPIGFLTGQEITIQDDVNKEYAIVTRGEVEEVVTTIDKSTPVIVVNSAYTTSKDARPQVLSNGWIVNAVIGGGSTIYLEISKDNGENWDLLAYKSVGTPYGLSLASKGNTVFLLYNYFDATMYCWSFDVPNVPMGADFSASTEGVGYYTVDSSQTALGTCSLTINSAQTELHACWSSKNATYPNSFNIRYAKGTINADGSVTWGSVEQVTKMNYSTFACISPSIALSGNVPYIIFIGDNAKLEPNSSIQNSKAVNIVGKTDVLPEVSNLGTGWYGQYVYDGGSYTQSSPDVITDKNGVLWVTWHGLDSTDTTTENIRCSKSTDGGVTWIKPSDGTVGHDKLTTGNTTYQKFPSITFDKDNKIYILWSGQVPGYYQIRQISFVSAWSSIINLTTNVTASSYYPSTCKNYEDFTSPLCIYRDDVNTRVAFRGIWNVTTQTPKLEISPLVNSYKTNAYVYRSLGKVEGGKLKFSDGFLSSNTYDRSTPTTVVASAYDTSGNGGRKLVRLSNGWLVAGVNDSTTPRGRLYVSKDDGITFTQLCSLNMNFTAGFAIASYGTQVYVLGTGTTAPNIYFFSINCLTQTDAVVQPLQSTGIEPSNQTAMGACSLAIDSNGVLHACWSSKNATYPNSFNIRYSKSTDGGVTWSTVEQVTGTNEPTHESIQPVIIIENMNPVIIFYTGYYKSIVCLRKDKGWSHGNYSYSLNPWGDKLIYQGNSYTQSNPCAVVDGAGVIHVVWQGLDSTANINNIRYSKSTDGGATWSSMSKLTTATANGYAGASIAVDKSNNIYIVFYGRESGSINNIYKLIYVTTWSSITALTTNTTQNAFNPSICANVADFTDPLFIWQDNQAPSVKFRGVWTEESYIPLLEEDVRYNIDPPPPDTTPEIVSWITFDKDVNFNIDSKASIVATNANESFGVMGRASYDEDETTQEDMFTYGATRDSKVSQRITLSRTNGSVDKGVIKLLGAISA